MLGLMNYRCCCCGRTTPYHDENLHRKTPFALTFGRKAVIPTEVGVPSYRIEAYNKAKDGENEEPLLVNLDLLKEQRDRTYVRLVTYKNAVA